MSSAVARPIRSSSNTLTSSKISFSLLLKLPASCPGWMTPRGGYGRDNSQRARTSGVSDLFDAGGLEAAGQVDAEFLGRAVHVVVGVEHLDPAAVAGEHLDVEAEALQ